MKNTKVGKIALFGSGELAASGRAVHEYLVKELSPPVKIALLETPAGFEDNPHHWYERLKETLTIGLQNYRPEVRLIPALRKKGTKGVNNSRLSEALLKADYIHAGAGSPTYTIRILRGSKIWDALLTAHGDGTPVSLASAAAVACGRFALPVYEIYKAGHELYWEEGLNLFDAWGYNLTLIPHWNNNEGGASIDTSRCYLGQRRFRQMVEILPDEGTTIVGIEEHTALICDFSCGLLTVRGTGDVVLRKGKETVKLKNSRYYKSQSLKTAEAIIADEAIEEVPAAPQYKAKEAQIELTELSRELQKLYRRRKAAREREDYTAADELRERFREQGYILRDTPDGTRIYLRQL